MEKHEISKDELLDHLDTAWDVIANASDWDTDGREDWQKAAERWRSEWEEILKITGQPLRGKNLTFVRKPTDARP